MRRCLFLLPVYLFAQSAPVNLGFGTGTPGETPPGWTVPQIQRSLGYSAEFRREGCRNTAGCAVLVPPNALPPDAFGTLTQTFDAKPYRGKTVRLRAFLKVGNGAISARGAGDHAQMSLRVDLVNGQMGFFDDMGNRPITSPQWASYDITGEIALEAETIGVAVISFGRSPVWIDGLTLEIVSGLSANEQMKPVREALGKLYARIDTAYAQKDMDAIASLAMPEATIRMGTTTLPLSTALLQIMKEMDGGVSYTSRSTITDVRMSGNDAIVSVNNEAARTAPDGKQILISANRDTWLKTREGWRLKESSLISTRSITPPTDSQAAAPVIAELRQRAAAVTTDDPGGAHDDLEAFGKAVGDARVVALGEATHGTREFFRLKHRLFEYLVTEKGFTVFAAEANWPESLAVDRYIKTGDGSARSALASLSFWTWNTEEMLDLIEWMRSYNQAPGNHPTLTFSSFDMQLARVAGPLVLEYLGHVSPDDIAAATDTYTQLQMMNSRRSQIYDEQAKALADGAAAVIRVLDVKRDALIAASSPEGWRNARHAAEVAFQSCSMRIPGKAAGYRDEMMASNVEWLRQTHPDEKIVLWGHNSHVGVDSTGVKSMGAWLRERYGKQLYVVGFAFRQGKLRAIGMENGKPTSLAVFDAIPSPEGTGDSILSAAGMPLFFLDLSSVPAGDPLSLWLGSSHLFHNVSANWVVGGADANLEPQTLSKLYDGLIFVQESHESHAIEN